MVTSLTIFTIVSYAMGSGCITQVVAEYKPPAEIVLVEVGASIGCVGDNAAKWLNDTNTIALYPLDKKDAIGSTIKGHGYYGTEATYLHFSPDGKIDTTHIPEFNNNNQKKGQSMKFDGTVQVLSNETYFINGSAMTVAAWVQCPPLSELGTPPPIEMIIASQSSMTDNITVAEWSLSIELGTEYCFNVRTMKANQGKLCTTSSAVLHGIPQHVIGLYYGSTATILIDGQLAVSNGWGPHFSEENTYQDVPDSDQSDTAFVIGGEYQPSNITSIPSNNFRGLLDEVHVYNKSLKHADTVFLFSCTEKFEDSTIFVYADHKARMKLVGHGFNQHQRVGLSIEPCENSTIDIKYLPPIFTIPFLGSDDLFIDFPAQQLHSPRTFYPKTDAISYQLCITTPLSPDRYMRSVGIEVMITRVDSINSRSDYIDINIADAVYVNKDVTIGGYGLEDGQVITISQWSDCSRPIASTFVKSTTPDRMNASISLKFNASVDVYHLCWKAKGSITFTGVNIGLNIILSGGNFDTRIIASNDGSFPIDRYKIETGIVDSNNTLNFFQKCATLDTFGTYFIEMTIGDYSDYLIPMKGSSACQVLMGVKKSRPITFHYYYSPVSPISPTFEGDVKPVPTSFYDNKVGGSTLGFPKDGRDQLNVWGSNNFFSVIRGGCCQMKATQTPSWDLPYQITAYKFSTTKLYFRVINPPNIVFSGEKFGITVKLSNLYGEVDSVQCNLSIKVNEGNFENISVSPCETTFSVSINNGTTSTIQLFLNSIMKKSIDVNIEPFPEYFRPLPINQNVPAVLGLLLSNHSTTPKWPSFVEMSEINIFFNFFNVPDPLIKPFDGQKDQIKIPGGKKDGVWTLLDLESVGIYGSGIPVNNTVQFFTFALYSTSLQVVKYNFTCVDTCSIFIDGKRIYPHIDSTLKGGNHQVVVKLFTLNTSGNETGFTFSYSEGYAIAFSPALPFDAPPSAITLTQGVEITQFMTTVSTFDGPFDFNYIGGDKSDSTVLPSLEDPRFTVVLGKSFPIRTSHSNESTTNYFACALYSSNQGRMSFNMPVVGGMMEVWVGGILVYRSVGAIPGGDVMGFNIPVGWHQLLIKAHVGNEEPNWNLDLVVENVISTVVYTTLELPVTLPEGATDMLKHPIDNMLQAQAEMGQYQVPYDYSQDNNPAANDPNFTDVAVDVKPQLFKNITIKGYRYKWQVVYSSSSDTGVFTPNMPDAGAYNQYYAFALYLNRPTDYVILSVLHYSGLGMWMNGKQVLGNVSHSTPSGEILNLTNVDEGWHQFLIRLQEPLNMKLFPVITAAKALPLCASKGFNLCAQYQDICPLRNPKPGTGWPINEDAYVVIANSQGGIGIGKKSLCKEVSSLPPGAKLHAACCGTSLMSTNFSIQLMEIKGDALIGWAPAIPQPQIPKPIFHVNESDGYTIVEILPGKGSPAGAILKYMIGDRTEVRKFNNYTKPLNITDVVQITAVAEFENRMSEASNILVTDIHHFELSRVMCPSVIPCVVQVTNGANTAEGSFAVLVIASKHDLIVKILNSSSFVQRTADNATYYTDLMIIGPDGFITTPEIGNRTQNKKIVLRMIVFPPGANHEDMSGILVNGNVVVFPLDIRSITQNDKTVPAIPYSPLALSGGFVGGDLLSFPQLQKNLDYKVCDNNICMQSMIMDSSDVHTIILSDGEALPLNLSGFQGTLECACMAAVGGSFVNSMKILRKHYYPTAQLISIKVNMPPKASKYAQLLSFGPPIISPLGSLSLVAYLPTSGQIDVVFQCAKNIVVCSKTVPTFTLTRENFNTSYENFKNEFVLRTLTGNVNIPPDKSIFGVWTVAIKLLDGKVLRVSGDPPPTVAVIDSPPRVTYADGACARNSTNCIDGAELIFIGNGYNYEELMYNSVIFLDTKTILRSRTVSCIPTKVSATKLTCKLNVVSEGLMEPIVLRVFLATLVAPILNDKFIDASFPRAEKDTGNSLLLNQDGPGWSGSLLPIPKPPAPTRPPTPSPSQKSVTLPYIIAGVAGGLLIIVLLIGTFVCVKYNFVRKPDNDELMHDIIGDSDGANTQYLRLNDGDVNDLPPATRGYSTHI